MVFDTRQRFNINCVPRHKSWRRYAPPLPLPSTSDPPPPPTLLTQSWIAVLTFDWLLPGSEFCGVTTPHQSLPQHFQTISCHDSFFFPLFYPSYIFIHIYKCNVFFCLFLKIISLLPRPWLLVSLALSFLLFEAFETRSVCAYLFTTEMQHRM